MAYRWHEPHNRAMRIYLETERMVLRALSEADEDDLFELDSDPEVMRYLTGGKATPRDDVRAALAKHIAGHEHFPGRGRWAAIEKSTGAFLGWMALEQPADTGPEQVELGYRLRRSAWGNGLATEGCRALIHKAFTDLGVQRVSAQTMAVNRASRRVMERAGLTFRRSFHQTFDDPIPGTEYGEVEYAIDKADWGGRDA